MNDEVTFLGRPCNEGHSGLRYKSDGTCVGCRRELSAARMNRIQNNGLDRPARAEKDIREDLAIMLRVQLRKQKERWGFI